MTQAVLERAIHSNLKVPKKKGSRESCDCLLGNDIGMYNTCYHGCLYCYANYSRDIVRDNFKKHDKNSPFLIGNFMALEKHMLLDYLKLMSLLKLCNL